MGTVKEMKELDWWAYPNGKRRKGCGGTAAFQKAGALHGIHLGIEHCGEVVVADIGIREVLMENNSENF